MFERQCFSKNKHSQTLVQVCSEESGKKEHTFIEAEVPISSFLRSVWVMSALAILDYRREQGLTLRRTFRLQTS